MGYKDLEKVKGIKDQYDDCLQKYSKIIQEEVDLEGLVENGETDNSSVTFDNHKIYVEHIAKESHKKLAEDIKKNMIN